MLPRSIGAAVLVAAAGTQVSCARTGDRAAAACPDSATAEAYGPATAAADSGKVFASLRSADGREFYWFARTGPGEEHYRIFRSRLAGDSWGPAAAMDLGASPSDLYPSLSDDGQRLVFSSYRPFPGDTSTHRNAHLWMARRAGDGWAAPVPLTASRPGWYHSGLRQHRGGALSFAMTSPDWRTQQAMVLAWEDSAYSSEAVPAPSEAATAYWRSRLGDSLHVWGSLEAPDSWWFVQISTVTAGRRGPGRFFATRRQDETWSDLVPAGGGLAEGAPNFLWFSADGCWVHYTRNYAAFMRVPMRVAVASRG